MAKITKKQAAISWQATLKAVRNATPVNPLESVTDQVARMKKLEAPGKHELWFKYYFPKFSYAEPTYFHTAASNRVINNAEWYETRLWSRELAKSTRTMMEVLYLCFVGHPLPDGGRKKKRFIVLTSCNQRNAEKLLRPYKTNLEANQRLVQDYGEQMKIGQWEKSEFTTRTGIAFIGVGLGENPRGLKNDEVRPDILLFDDVDTDQDCRNPEMVNNNWKWIDEAVMGTRSISCETTVIWCGNRIAVDCCIFRASQYADYQQTINIRDENGKTTWPSKNTEEHIKRVLSKRSYAAIQKEYFNNPIVEGSVFKKMAYKPALPINEYSMLVCYTDPSFKDTKKNDYKATVLVGKWQDEFHVIKAFVEQTTTANMIAWHYEIMAMVGEKSCYYFMEEVFLQELILSEFYKTSKANGRTIPIMGDQRSKDDKFTRIETLLEPLHRNGKLWLNENEIKDIHMMNLNEQFIAFAPGSRAHDDAPDAVEGAVWIINNKVIAKDAGITIIKRTGNKHRY